MTATRKTALIIGGYGNFGGRIAEILSDDAGLTLLIAGRSIATAEGFCNELQSRAILQPTLFDRDGDLESQLRQASPDIVVDASGPFQVYGDDPYRLVKAALALGVNYIDLADSSDFIEGISQFNDVARTRGIFMLSGASTCPSLTTAVVRSLSGDMTHLDSVSAGIAPSPHTILGKSVIKAIASYAGKPIHILEHGKNTTKFALTESRTVTIAPPGHIPLSPLKFSLVDVPDLKLLPRLWTGLKSVWMGAGPSPVLLHRILNGMAWAIRLKLLPSLSPFTNTIHWASSTFRWGQHRGGMFVNVEGRDSAGQTITRSWHAIADGNDGPYIPAMASAAIIRRCMDGYPPSHGARASTQELELADYESFFVRYAIYAGIRDKQDSTAPLYKRILSTAWGNLPNRIQEMHNLTNVTIAEGTATVHRGEALFARLVALVFGFPKSGSDVPVTVCFRKDGEREVWTRQFGTAAFSSTQEEGRGRFAQLLCERFGPFAIGLALHQDDDKLRLIVRGWSIFGIPLPSALAPRGNTYENVVNDRFGFHVEIDHPMTGLIVRYQGSLTPRPGVPPRKPVAST